MSENSWIEYTTLIYYFFLILCSKIIGAPIGGGRGRAGPSSAGASKTSVVESLKMSITLLCEMMPASANTSELSRNDIVSDLILQIGELQSGLAHVIEQELSSSSDVSQKKFNCFLLFTRILLPLQYFIIYVAHLSFSILLILSCFFISKECG